MDALPVETSGLEPNSCRWASLRGDVMCPDQSLIDLPVDEQVSRGQELMQMLNFTGMSPSSASAAHGQSSSPRNRRMDRDALASSEAVRVLVRRTFIELVPAKAAFKGRQRAFTWGGSEVFDSKARDEPWQKISDCVLSDLSDASTEDRSGSVTPVRQPDASAEHDAPVGSRSSSPDRSMSDATPYAEGQPTMMPAQCMDGVCWMPMGSGFEGMPMMMGPGDWQWGFPMACAMPYADGQFDGGADAMFYSAATGAYDCAIETAGADEPEGPRTTVMLRNLPSAYSRSMLIELLDAEGFETRYDFVYLPIDFNSQAGLGYAFVDFPSPEDADWCQEHFEGFCEWSTPSEKVCSVTWAGPHQGLVAHVQRYRNSPVMHETVPDEWKPAMFLSGSRVPFPPPTIAIRKPKIRRRPDGVTTKTTA